MASAYYQLLKHPLWQEKRLRILERDHFECSNCGAKDSTLHVHHGYYAKGKKPWEYPDESLCALCELCHTARQQELADVQELVGLLGSSAYFGMVIGYMKALLSISKDEKFDFTSVADGEQFDGAEDCLVGFKRRKERR